MPTREEWKKWIESVVEFEGFGLNRKGMEELEKILLAMPCVPEETNERDKV